MAPGYDALYPHGTALNERLHKLVCELLRDGLEYVFHVDPYLATRRAKPGPMPPRPH